MIEKKKREKQKPRDPKPEDLIIFTRDASVALCVSLLISILLPNSTQSLTRWGDSLELNSFKNSLIQLLTDFQDGVISLDEFDTEMSSLLVKYDEQFSELQEFSQSQINLSNNQFTQVTAAVTMNRNQFTQEITEWVARKDAGTLLNSEMVLGDELYTINRQDLLESLNADAQDFLWQYWGNTVGNNTVSVFGLIVFLMAAEVIRRKLGLLSFDNEKKKNDGRVNSAINNLAETNDVGDDEIIPYNDNDTSYRRYT